MIPHEIVELANLICPGWTDGDDLTLNETLDAAWAVHNAGYRKAVKNPDQQQEKPSADFLEPGQVSSMLARRAKGDWD